MAAFAYHTAYRDASVQQSAAVSPKIMLKEKFMDFRVPEVHSVQFRGSEVHSVRKRTYLSVSFSLALR